MTKPYGSGIKAATLAGVMAAAAAAAQGQTPHIFGIHDDPGSASNILSLYPGGNGWVTATEALGSNPGDTSGKNYGGGLPAGTTIIARLNNGYFPNGTIPVKAQYANFAQRVANFVQNSSGCTRWVIGNETNLAIEWPDTGSSSLETITPQDYADCFVLCYNAIKAVRPNDEVYVQALAPWAGPYGAGNLGGYSHGPAPANNWADYKYAMLQAILDQGVTPDGIATHINTRGYNLTSFNPQPITSTNLTLDFSWGVYRDWVQFGIPRELWHLPLYATECNGRDWWKGGGPESGTAPPYQAGWAQQVFSRVNEWNQTASQIGLPVYRAVNLYRWVNADDWSLEVEWSGNTSVWQQLSADISSAAANSYTWPASGGNALNLGTPPGFKANPAAVSAISEEVGFEASRAFDDDFNTNWSSVETSAGVAKWLAADLGAEVEITGYIVRHASVNAVNNTNRNTIGFWIETRNDPSDPWELQTMVRNNTPGAHGAAVTELVYDTPVMARHVRLYINDAAAPGVANGERGRITEFEIYTSTAHVGDWFLLQ